MSLAVRLAFVTGGASGNGLAFTRALAVAGASATLSGLGSAFVADEARASAKADRAHGGYDADMTKPFLA